MVVFTNVSAVEHALANLGLLVLLGAVDHLLLKPWIQSRTERKHVRTARWFFIHSFANMGIVLTALNSLRAVLSDPVHAGDGTVFSDTSFFGDASRWPVTIINSVHVYHMVGGFGLNSADYFHHLLFIPTLGFPGQVFPFAALGNWQAFFISGLPGGVDYCLLGLVKVGLLQGLTEKRVNANLNVWVRAPGILFCWVLALQALLLGNCQAPLWAVLLQVILPPYNAMYFCKQAVANYAVHYMLDLLGQDELIKKHISERTSVTTGTDVLSWKDQLGVPQRGS